MVISGLGLKVSVGRIKTSWWRRPTVVLVAEVIGAGKSGIETTPELEAGDIVEFPITINAKD